MSQNCRNTLTLHTVDQQVRSAENETPFYLYETGIRHRLDGPISDCKSVGVLPRAIASLANSSQFYECWSNSIQLPIQLHVGRGKCFTWLRQEPLENGIKYL